VKRHAMGAWGEEQALKKLKSLGYQFRDRNWHATTGEIDLILEDRGEVVFVEVKTRSSGRFGRPEDGLTPRKKASILQAALAYLDVHDLWEVSWRVDVVAIECTSNGKLKRMDHYVNVNMEPGELPV